MAFSTFNSMTTMNVIIDIPGPPSTPLNPYISAVSSNSISISFTKPLGKTPSMYHANITSDGVNYSIFGNTISPIIATGLTSNIVYNGTLYASRKGFFSNTIAIGNAYVMPVGQNTIASTLGPFNNKYAGGNNTTYIGGGIVSVNKYTQGISSLSNENCILYINANNTLGLKNMESIYIPNIKAVNIEADVTFYMKMSGNDLYSRYFGNRCISIFNLTVGLGPPASSSGFRIGLYSFYIPTHSGNGPKSGSPGTPLMVYRYMNGINYSNYKFSDKYPGLGYINNFDISVNNINYNNNDTNITNIHHIFIYINNGKIGCKIFNNKILVYHAETRDSYSYSDISSNFTSKPKNNVAMCEIGGGGSSGGTDYLRSFTNYPNPFYINDPDNKDSQNYPNTTYPTIERPFTGATEIYGLNKLNLYDFRVFDRFLQDGEIIQIVNYN
jgi:hypothetical protein